MLAISLFLAQVIQHSDSRPEVYFMVIEYCGMVCSVTYPSLSPTSIIFLQKPLSGYLNTPESTSTTFSFNNAPVTSRGSLNLFVSGSFPLLPHPSNPHVYSLPASEIARVQYLPAETLTIFVELRRPETIPGTPSLQLCPDRQVI